MSSFISRLQARVSKEESGFTLIELLIVLVIIGILLAIAVPSYLGFKDRANKTAAQANVRSAVPTIETYFADNNTYVGMTTTNLAAIDAGIQITVVSGSLSTYCVSNTQGGFAYYKNGPSGAIGTTVCT